MRAGLVTRKRLLTMLTALTMLFALVGIRIGFLTIRDTEALTARGVRQWTREGVVTAQRGRIEDTRGDVLALSTTAYIVTANPQQVKDEAALSKVLSPILDADPEAMEAKLQNKKLASVILKRQVSRDIIDTIRSLRTDSQEMNALLRGISFDEDTKRVYPKGELLSQVLGLTNVDSAGQSGLESLYETLLRGKAGSLRTEVDARSRLLPDGKTAYVAPQPGYTLRLTVDSAIQGVVERAMRECIQVNDAVSVQCIVMDVNTGAILALCMKPDYDPNDPPRNDIETLRELMRITVVSDVYEPGSTFKMLTCSAALDSGAASLTDRFTCTGAITVDGDRIRCWKNSHGNQDLPTALANSCNPAFVTLALRMGTETFYKYLRAFGLGVKTGVDLPGESAGILINPKYVKNVDLARIGFGQSVAVTPLQMITAACSVVNGGRLMKPYIVREVLDAQGNTVDRVSPTVVANPIKPETSEVMRTLLENVVENGGGKNAAVPGYRIGGKTGTAQVYKDGRVVSNVHIGSFLGFAPIDQPRFAVLVTVNEAKVPVDYGSTTAAPFASQIMAEVLNYLGVRKADPDATEPPAVTVPDVRGLTVAEARKALSDAMLLYETDGLSPAVSDQAPAAGAKLPAGAKVMLYTFEQTPLQPMDLVSVPSVKGLSMVEAGRQLRARGFEMEIAGSGLAIRQEPAANTFAPPGSRVKVIFELP